MSASLSCNSFLVCHLLFRFAARSSFAILVGVAMVVVAASRCQRRLEEGPMGARYFFESTVVLVRDEAVAEMGVFTKDSFRRCLSSCRDVLSARPQCF